MKKTLNVVLVAVVFFMFGFSHVGAESFEIENEIIPANEIFEEKSIEIVENSSKSYEEIEEIYGKGIIVDPSDLPEDAELIEFNSEEELETFMRLLDEQSNEDVVEIEEPSFSLLSTTPEVRIVRTASKGLGGISGKLNISADFWVIRSGSFGQINSVKGVKTYLTGVTFPFTWNQTSAYGNITANKQSATAYGSGIQEYWMIVNGLIKLYEKRHDISVTYKIG